MDMTESTISTELMFEGKVINVRKDTVRLPNGKVASREVVEHNGGVCVAALTDKQELLMVRQYRYPVKEVLIEVPAGKIGVGEDPRSCGIRELKEETGCTASEFICIGRIYPSPGYSAEIIYIYLATGLTFGECCPDEDEFLQVEALPLQRVEQMIADGEIKDGKTIAAVFLTRRYLSKEHGL